jgi:hypothetical protein
LSPLPSTQGSVINGAAFGEESGTSVSSAGDFNNDGISDVIIGAPNAASLGRTKAGKNLCCLWKTRRLFNPY